MTAIVVAHGAWSAGWAWKKMRPLLAASGHQLYVPTYTGLGERQHLASPENDLETHIADVCGTLHCEDLRDVMLVGHSYGGMVATGVADRAADRVARLVYLDAFVPRDGQSLADIAGPNGGNAMRERARAAGGDGWLVPPNPLPPDTPEADVAWIMPRRYSKSLRCFESKIRLSAEPAMKRAYVYCRRAAPGDVFRQFAARARGEGWPYFEIDSSHNPHITAPEALRAVLLEAMG
jgi:pimeloyl-ACP methyl ester carboxylesterase